MTPNESHQYPDAALLALLDRCDHERRRLDRDPQCDDARSALARADRELGEFLYRFLHEHLKPRFRRAFPGTDQDSAVRFTEMLNSFFVEVLERKPDAVWRARSTQAIARHISIALRNDIRDALRAHKRREKHVATGLGTGSEGGDTDYIEPIALSRQAHFEERHGIALVDALDAMNTWVERGSPWVEREEALRLRYLDGLTYEAMATQMGVGVARVKDLLAEGLGALKRALSP